MSVRNHDDIIVKYYFQVANLPQRYDQSFTWEYWFFIKIGPILHQLVFDHIQNQVER